jgi:hypothetical protein
MGGHVALQHLRARDHVIAEEEEQGPVGCPNARVPCCPWTPMVLDDDPYVTKGWRGLICPVDHHDRLEPPNRLAAKRLERPTENRPAVARWDDD